MTGAMRRALAAALARDRADADERAEALRLEEPRGRIAPRDAAADVHGELLEVLHRVVLARTDLGHDGRGVHDELEPASAPISKSDHGKPGDRAA